MVAAGAVGTEVVAWEVNMGGAALAVAEGVAVALVVVALEEEEPAAVAQVGDGVGVAAGRAARAQQRPLCEDGRHTRWKEGRALRPAPVPGKAHTCQCLRQHCQAASNPQKGPLGEGRL